jgi:hypothetical protein
MSFKTTITQTAVFNAVAIRDTNPANSDAFLLDQLDHKALIVINGLDQSITLKTQLSFDGTDWMDVGNTATVNAGDSLVTDQYDEILTGIKAISGYIRLVATASSAPTSGTLTAYIQGMSC